MATTFTVAQYKTWLRGRLPGITFTDSLLTEIADSVNKELCNAAEWPFMEKTFTGTVATGLRQIDLPASIPTLQLPLSLQLVDPDAYAVYPTYVSWRELYRRYPDPDQYSGQRPNLWSIFGTTMILGPAKTDRIYTFRMSYIAAPTSLTADATVVDIPDAFSEVFITGMMIRGLKSKNKYNQAQVLQQDYDKLYKDMQDRGLIRQKADPPRINTGARRYGFKDPWGDYE